MAEVVTVVADKPFVREITLKLSASEARDVLIYIDSYYKRIGLFATLPANSMHRAISDALKGVKPKFDGINVANGKVSIL